MEIQQAKLFLENEAFRPTAKQQREIHDFVAKLASYHDMTYITTEWLRNNGFEKHEVPYLERCLYTYIYRDDTLEIEAVLHDEERGIWEVTITYYDESNTDQDVVYICTLGQFRMFLAICGRDNIVEQLK